MASKYLFAIPLLVSSFLLNAQPAGAIVVIPALILVPVVKVIAFAIGVFSLPAAGLGGVLAHLKGKSPIKWMFWSFMAVIFTALLTGMVLKLLQPERSIF